MLGKISRRVDRELERAVVEISCQASAGIVIPLSGLECLYRGRREKEERGIEQARQTPLGERFEFLGIPASTSSQKAAVSLLWDRESAFLFRAGPRLR